MLFAAFSLLLCVFRGGYLISTRQCKPTSMVLSPFIEAPFLALQVITFTFSARKELVGRPRHVDEDRWRGVKEETQTVMFVFGHELK